MRKLTLLTILTLSACMVNAAEEAKKTYQFLDHARWTVSARHDLIPAELNNLLDNNVDTYLTLVQPNKTGIDLSPEITGITTGEEVYFMIDMQAPQTFDCILFRNPHSIDGPKNGIGVPDKEKVKGFKVYGGDDMDRLELIYDHSAPASPMISWTEPDIKLETPVSCQYVKVVLIPNSTAGDFLKIPEFDLGNIVTQMGSNVEDRSAWGLTTTHALVDNSVAGNLFDTESNPDRPTYIALVKPGGKLGSVDLTADLTAKVGFTVDLGQNTAFDYIQIGHRLGAGNNLRVAGAIFSGSNDNTTFTTLIDSRRLLIGAGVNSGYYMPLEERQNYRYIKCEFTAWDVTGNTLQLADFNIGTFSGSSSIDTPVEVGALLSSTSVRVGESIVISGEQTPFVELCDLSGALVLSTYSSTLETSNLQPGLYLLTVTTEKGKGTTKISIK